MSFMFYKHVKLSRSTLYVGDLCNNIGLVLAWWSCITASPRHHEISILSPLLFMHVGHPYIPLFKRIFERAMAESSWFASPVNDATEEQLRLTRIPEKTKSAIARGIRVWSDWATARASTVETAGHAPVGTPLLKMQVEDLAYWISKFMLDA